MNFASVRRNPICVAFVGINFAFEKQTMVLRLQLLQAAPLLYRWARTERAQTTAHSSLAYTSPSSLNRN
jgi:hypothetical protein